MTPKEIASAAREIIENAQRLVNEAKRGAALMVYKEIIVPHIKEYNLYLRWRMGAVFFNDYLGHELDDDDPRVKSLDEKMEEVLEGIDLIHNDYHNLLWWVLSEQSHEAAGPDGKPMEWFYGNDAPAEKEQDRRFGDLNTGDYIYVVDYYTGEIDKLVIQKATLIHGDMIQLEFLDPGWSDSIVEPGHKRSQNVFTSYQKAGNSLDNLFGMYQHNNNFYFKEEPDEILAKILNKAA